MKQGKYSASSLPSFSESPAIDWPLCIRLANNKKMVAQEILLLVLQQLPSDLQLIKQAQEKADNAELLRQIHKLHGALCYSGMPRLKNAAAQLENVLKQASVDTAKLLHCSAQLEAEAATVLSSPLPC